MTPGNVDALASDELEINDTSRWVDENVPQIRVPSVSIGALGDQPYVRCAHRHRGLLGTAARVDGASRSRGQCQVWRTDACQGERDVLKSV